jgi:hypothetical protein
MTDVVGAGLVVLDRIYTPDTPPLEALGGTCGNVLISLATLAHDIYLVAIIGRDVPGDKLVNFLSKAGVHSDYVTQTHLVSTPIIAEVLDLRTRHHTFSLLCPETNVAFVFNISWFNHIIPGFKWYTYFSSPLSCVLGLLAHIEMFDVMYHSFQAER